MFHRPTLLRLLAANSGAGAGSGSNPGNAPGQSGGAAAPSGAGSGSLPGVAEAGMTLGGRYQLISPIASGGMAQVWRAQDISLVRPVALKILHPHLATDEAFVARFRREAIASARLSHPSIVAVYDTLSEGGVEAIVMELIEGRTLRAVLDEAGVLPPGDVIDVGVQISEALDEAHRAGIVHRDIKPANIMVSADRRIMVTDFGIAKAQKDADLTHTGTLLGTAKYLAPEQVAGEPVDARADIYALGIVLFEAATGKPPFLADTDAATALARLQNDPPRCRHRLSSVPVGLDEVIARSMARNPDERYDRALSFKAALSTVDINDIRSDTSDLGPAVLGAAGAAAMPATSPPPAAPGAAVAEPPVNNPGTAILTTPTGLQHGGPADDVKLNRKQRKAAKRNAKATPGGLTPAAGRGSVMPIEGKQRPTKTLVAVLVIGGFVVSGMLLATLLNPDTSIGNGSLPSGSSAAMVEAVSFDPLGDGDERPDLTAFAIDGDQETLWRTDTYTREGFGNLKAGVGLILTLESESSLGQLTLVTANEGWDAEIYVGDEFGPDSRDFDPSALGDPAAVIEDGSETEEVSLDGARGSKILLWITETGLTDDRNDKPVRRFILFEAFL